MERNLRVRDKDIVLALPDIFCVFDFQPCEIKDVNYIYEKKGYM